MRAIRRNSARNSAQFPDAPQSLVLQRESGVEPPLSLGQLCATDDADIAYIDPEDDAEHMARLRRFHTALLSSLDPAGDLRSFYHSSVLAAAKSTARRDVNIVKKNVEA